MPRIREFESIITAPGGKSAVTTVKGYPLILPEPIWAMALRCMIYKNDQSKLWHVVELSSGFGIGRGRDREKAKSDAMAMLKDHGQAKFEQRLAAAHEKFGKLNHTEDTD